MLLRSSSSQVLHIQIISVHFSVVMSSYEEVKVSSNRPKNTPHNSAQIVPVHFFWLPDPFGTHCPSAVLPSLCFFSFFNKTSSSPA